MPRGRGGRHVEVDVTVSGGHHHGHHHHHHHGPGAGKLIAAGVVGAAAGAAVASSHNNNPPPQQHGATVVVVEQQQQPAYYPPPQQAYYPPPQQQAYYPPQQQGYYPPPQQQVTVVHAGGPPPHAHGHQKTSVTIIHTGPIRAVNLGKKWHNGNVIHLENVRSRKNLRITKHGKVDADGGTGDWAKFVVERIGPDRVKLRNVGHNNYLRVPDGHTVDHGHGIGQACDFWVIKHSNKIYSLESCAHPGCHVGFHDNGSVKPPHNCGIGRHAQFRVTVHRWAC